MKVRITYTVEVNEEIRRGIREHYHEDGLATRQEIKDWYRTYGESMDTDLVAYS